MYTETRQSKQEEEGKLSTSWLSVDATLSFDFTLFMNHSFISPIAQLSRLILNIIKF